MKSKQTVVGIRASARRTLKQVLEDVGTLRRERHDAVEQRELQRRLAKPGAKQLLAAARRLAKREREIRVAIERLGLRLDRSGYGNPEGEVIARLAYEVARPLNAALAEADRVAVERIEKAFRDLLAAMDTADAQAAQHALRAFEKTAAAVRKELAPAARA